jgi:MFS family permease
MGWSRTEIMTAFTIMVLCIAVTAPFAGKMTDRYGVRIVFPIGAGLGSIGLVILSQMTSLWHYYIGYTVLGIGITGISHITTSFALSHWFVKKRGLVIGTIGMGAGSGGIIFSPLIALCLLPQLGWSNTYLVLAATLGGVLIPLSLFVVRNKPSDMNLLPDGAASWEATSINEPKNFAADGLSLRAAFSTGAFWLLAGAVFCIHTHMGIHQSLVPHVDDLGFANSIGALIVSINTGACIAGNFFFGWLCDRISAKFAGVIGQCLMTLGIVILLNINGDSPLWMIWLFSLTFGISMGNWMPTMSVLTSSNFGIASYGAIFGTLNFFQNISAAASPLLAGFIYDATDSYRWAFILILVAVVLAIPLILGVRRPSSYHPARIGEA